MKERTSKRLARRVWKSLKKYLANSSVHGMGYIVEDGRHWMERIFWLICCGLSWWGCILMVTKVITDYGSQRVATAADTNYIGWETRLPSIHVCVSNTPQAKAYIKKTWPQIRQMTGLTNPLSFGYQKQQPEPYDSAAYEGIANALHVPCGEVFKSCEWNDAKFNCCTIFRPLKTLVGHCLSANSLQTRDFGTDNELDPFFVRNLTSSGIFTIYFRDDGNRSFVDKMERFPTTKIYLTNIVHMPSTLTADEARVTSRWRTSHIRLHVQLHAMFHDEGVRSIPVENRNCRFINEIELYRHFHAYSPISCMAELQLQRMIATCGCISHLYPNNAKLPVCNYTQLACLYRETRTILDSSNVTCKNPCEDITHTFFTTNRGDREPGRLDIKFVPGPTLRYRGYVVSTKIDLVVTVGGVVGLFVGASFLTLIEVPYWFVRSIYDDDDDDDDDDDQDENEDCKVND